MTAETKERYIKSSEAEELELMKESQSETDIMYEDTRKREKNTKHFRLRNGNYRAVIYDYPIHKYDEESGRFVDIPTDYSETENDYEAEFENYKVKFPKKDGKRRFITVNKGEKKFSWRYAFEKEGERNIRSSAHLHSVNKNKWDNERSHIKYVKIDGKSDLEYSVNDGGIKESIILSECPETSVFSFEIKTHGLVPRLSANKKRVELVSNKEEVATAEAEMVIPEPNMVDNNGAYSEELHYEIRKTENGTFLDIIADNTWLADPDRVYPVTVDPVVKIIGGTVGFIKVVQITSADSSSPTEDEVIVGTSEGTPYRVYVGIRKCDLPQVPEGYKVSRAGFTLVKNTVECSTDSEKYDVYAFDNVPENNLTWNTSEAFDSSAIIKTITTNCGEEASYIDISIKKHIGDWQSITNTSSYCGIMLKQEAENTAVNSNISLCSNYAEYSAYRPSLYIEYASEDTYADHQKYHTFDLVNSGRGKINLSTGKLNFIHSDISLKASRMPISVSHIYTGRDEGVTYGMGWRLSCDHRLNMEAISDSYAVYTDSAGRKHTFVANGVSAADIEGLGYTLENTCDCEPMEGCAHVITDERDNKMYFNSAGRLVGMNDAYNNQLHFEYSGEYLIKISDESGNFVDFIYSASKLSALKYNDGESYEYVYDGDCLVRIKHPSNSNDIRITNFVYNNEMLTAINDCSGSTYEVNYDLDGRVFSLQKTDARVDENNSLVSGDLSDDKIIFEYYNAMTIVENDRTKIKNVYKWDENGRLRSTYVDTLEASDSTLSDETTMTEIFNYQYKKGKDGSDKTGKYCSLSVGLNNAASNQNNMVIGGNFDGELNSNYYPPGWTVVGAEENIVEIGDDSSIPSGHCFHFTWENNNSSKYMAQKVILTDKNIKGNILVASAWAKRINLTGEESGDGREKFCISAKVKYTDGTTRTYTEDFNPQYYEWQYAAIPAAIDKTNAPTEIILTLDCSRMKGDFYFSNVRLVDTYGTVIENTYNPSAPEKVGESYICLNRTTKSYDGIYTTTEYIDLNSDAVKIKIEDPDGEAFVIEKTYNEKHKLLKSKDYRGIVKEYSYSDYGELLQEKISKEGSFTNPNECKLFKYTYDENGMLRGETDPRYYFNGAEHKRIYSYDSGGKGLLTSTIDFNGQEYVNTYDAKTDEPSSIYSIDGNEALLNEFSYRHGLLTEVGHNSFCFNFTYDGLGREQYVDIEHSPLLTKSYSDTPTTNSVKTVYASGEETEITSDSFGNPVSRTYKTETDTESRTLLTAKYDAAGNLTEYLDNESGICYTYEYDSLGNVIEEKQYKGTTYLCTNYYDYNYGYNSRLEETLYGATGQKYKPIYEMNDDGYYYPENAVVGVVLETKQGSDYTVKYKVETTKDHLERPECNFLTLEDDVHPLLLQEYTYLKTADPDEAGKYITTDFVASVEDQTYGVADKTTAYTYDASGNIETVTENGTLVLKYYYDKWNRLIRENNHKLNKTYTWRYDEGGNILEKRTYSLCTAESLPDAYEASSYSYEVIGNRDRLAKFNNECCIYDVLGNPTMYRCHSLEWTKARKLARFGANTFEYNASGIRIKKNDTVYTLAGTKILKETTGSNTITYYYGTGIAPVGFNYNGTDYYFRKNIQGDVVAIYDTEGDIVANYVYDAWGNHKIYDANNNEVTSTTHVGFINPIRYRGYYFDVETNLYYLQTRYYDPETGRFLNSDAIEYLAPEQLGGLNLYAYCNNNPVMFCDRNGNEGVAMKILFVVAMTLVGAFVGALIGAIDYSVHTDEFSYREMWAAVAGGATSGAISSGISTLSAGTVVGPVFGGAIGGFFGEIGGTIVEDAINGEIGINTVGKAGYNALWGAGGGALGGLVAGPVGTPLAAQAKGFLARPIYSIFSQLIEDLMLEFSNWYFESGVENFVNELLGDN